jgi:Domain of unknown function (DUF4402)
MWVASYVVKACNTCFNPLFTMNVVPAIAMIAFRALLSAVLLVFVTPAPTLAQSCRLCSAPDDTPLSIDITTKLDFSRAALTGKGDGQIKVDPQNGNSMQGGIVALGGYAAAGTVLLKGAPGKSVRIDLPRTVRMTSPAGGVIEIVNFRTNLGPAPRLDMAGQLTFAFGGDLVVTGNLSGKFRGRIPITAQYE